MTDYRKPEVPKKLPPLRSKRTGWPHTEANPRHGVVIEKKIMHPHHPDPEPEVDEALEAFSRRARMNDFIFENLRTLFLCSVPVILLILFIMLMVSRQRADVEEREACERSGGRVEELHTENGGWVCLR